MKLINILIIDDHKLIRESLALVLTSRLSFRVLATFENVEQALKEPEAHCPDIILMDINLGGMDGIDATPLVKSQWPNVKVIGVSMNTHPSYVTRMLRNGADGYVTKNSTHDEIFLAINEVSEGRKFLCAEVRPVLSELMLDNSSALHVLSSKQLTILEHIRKGLSSREIAASLNISQKTVEVHRYNILKKLQLKNTASLVSFAFANGF